MAEKAEKRDDITMDKEMNPSRKGVIVFKANKV
jgi:hypothetical protein